MSSSTHHRILIPLAAFLAVLPILLKGPSCGHDFDFHLLSWLEASTQFAHLHYPHWAYTPAYNAGEPRFLFYPPISWSLGALLGLILPWTLVPAAFTFLALTLSGFTAHALARRSVDNNAATLAAILYLLNPYMLFTAYERTAYGELLAAAWLPLLFAAALAPRIRLVPLAIPIALLWLTNAPAAVMSCYALAVITLIRLIFPPRPTTNLRHSERSEEPLYLSSSPNEQLRAPFIAPLSHAMSGKPRLHLALTTLAATLLGLTLSAFYLLPAAYERPHIQSDMATIEGMRIVDNTLFHHMSPVTDDTLEHDAVLHTASVLSMLLLAAIALASATLWVPHPRGARGGTPLVATLLLTLLIALLLTPISLPIWTHTPELRFLQFPWRLNAILSTIFIFIAAQALARLKLSSITTYTGTGLFAAALIVPAWHLFQQPCDDEDNVKARVALYHSNLGTEPTDEYTPTTADNDSLGKSNPPYWLTANLDDCDEPAPLAAILGQTPTHLTLILKKPELLFLDRRSFPLWQIRLNGVLTTPACTREDGLLAVALPAGTDTITLTEHRSPDQTAGLALTAASASLLTLALFHTRRKPMGT